MSLRRPQLVAALDISDRQLQRLLAAGLPFTPVGVRGQRFDLDECKTWITTHRRAAPDRLTGDETLEHFGACLDAAFSGASAPLSSKPLAPCGRIPSGSQRPHVLRRTPAWADRAAIRQVYEQARALTRQTGIEHHVDHVIPLRGELVSGLHVANNLRALPARHNRSKNNRYAP